jgi:hypothetical protein
MRAGSGKPACMKKFGVLGLNEISDVLVQFGHPDQKLCDELARERVDQMTLNCARYAAHNASQLIKAETRQEKGH